MKILRRVALTIALPERQKRFAAQITLATLLSVAAAYGCAAILGSRTPRIAQLYIVYSLLGLMLVAGISLLLYTFTLMAHGEQRPLKLVWNRSRQYLTPAAFIDRLLPILLVFTFLGAFSVFKSLIPKLHPFSWDAAFSDLDRLIFGTDPWRITHAWLGPAGTALIDYAYIMWLPVFACVVFWHSVFAPFEQKRRFFLSFFGCWLLLGVVSAILLSSAGPCFLGLIGHPYADRYPFFPMKYGPGSQAIMNYLAEGYAKGDFGIAKGISAMPSMHVAVVTLYLLTARRPWTVFLSGVYFLVVLVGSVHLGWHYAVDGFAAAAGTVLIYILTAGRSARLSPLTGREMPQSA